MNSHWRTETTSHIDWHWLKWFARTSWTRFLALAVQTQDELSVTLLLVEHRGHLFSCGVHSSVPLGVVWYLQVYIFSSALMFHFPAIAEHFMFLVLFWNRRPDCSFGFSKCLFYSPHMMWYPPLKGKYHACPVRNHSNGLKFWILVIDMWASHVSHICCINLTLSEH